jgi:NodT family efflux transporter outer membrane factor (OMF) lipoprotein
MPSDSRRLISPRSTLHLAAALGFMLLAGCSLHKTNVAPSPLKGGQASPIGEAPATSAPAPWWAQLSSPPLDTLIRHSLDANFDVRASRERIHQALAAYRRSRAGLLPSFEVEAQADREVHARGRARRETEWQTGANLEWTPDLFGRQSDAARARAAEAWTRIHESDNFRLNLSVAVAEAYFGIIEQRWLLTLLEEQRGTANELLRIIEQRYDEGLISKLDVLQQQSQVADLETQIPVAKATLQDLQNELGALLGTLPGEMKIEAIGENARFPVIDAFARQERVDLLLLRRPDLSASRAALVAADAETGRALAERLPRLTLSAEALRVEGRSPAVTVFSLGAELVQPIIDWGARRQEWVRTRAVYRERLATFSQDFLQATWEVEALIQNEARQRELLERLGARRAILESLIKQARSRYDAGLTDYLPVLSATQQLYSVEQRSIRENRRLTSTRVALLRALGGPVTPDSDRPLFTPLAHR